MARTQGRRVGHRDEEGAAIIEFALLAPILLMLLLGTITTALSFSNAIGLTSAVREGSRFGATADATLGTWADDVIAKTRTSQFDDSPTTPATAVCVKLMKWSSTGTPTTVVPSTCSAGSSATGADAAAGYPPIPSGLTSGQCVVLIGAARPYQINAVLINWDRQILRGAVARYERAIC
jgi:Flp pilus assembly protein TadG